VNGPLKSPPGPFSTFTLPSLTTLFITLTDKSKYGEPPTESEKDTFFELEYWFFPDLHTFSIDARGWIKVEALNEVILTPGEDGQQKNKKTTQGDVTNQENGSDDGQTDKQADSDNAWVNLSLKKKSPEIDQPHRPTAIVYAFIRKHKDTLKALRMLPFSTIDLAGVESDSPQSKDTGSISFPLLQTIATDFVQYSPSIYPELKPSATSKTNGGPRPQLSLPNLKHLIHISTRACTQGAFSTSLLRALRAPTTPTTAPTAVPANKIESLTITEEPYMVRRRPYLEYEVGLEALGALDRYCEENGVRAYAEMGMEVCCVQAAWRRLLRD
jgi:hypothetical protein